MKSKARITAIGTYVSAVKDSLHRNNKKGEM